MAAKFLSLLLLSALGRTAAQSKCANDGSDYSYTESISGQTRTITTTFCPNHPFKNINPNYPIKSSTTYKVPAYPIYDSANTADLSEQGGYVGILFSGAMLFSPYGGTSYGKVTAYNNSATYAEGYTFDMCGGHAASTTEASYHNHVPPDCLLKQLGQTSSSHSPQVGWAADGFPVYGPRGPSGVMMQTCTITGGTYGTDVCTNAYGGYYRNLSSVDDFVFRYYTLGTYNDGTSCTTPRSDLPGASYYPNTPTMYFGCCPSSVSCSASFLKSCTTATSTTRVNGYTNSYTATAKYPSGLSRNCAACWTSSENGATPAACNSSNSTNSTSAAVPIHAATPITSFLAFLGLLLAL